MESALRARISTDGCTADGGSSAIRWTLTGTHRAAFQGIPATGCSVKFAGIEYNRVVDGRIAEHWAQFDMMGLLQQLGAMPA